MILPTDRILPTVWHITLFIGCLYEWSRKSCQSSVCYTASHVFIHLENEWSYPLIECYRPYGILHVSIGCLYEWSRRSCQSSVCYTASHFFIHLENEWSYPLIECYRPYGILHVFIGCLYEWSRKSCQSLVCYTASRPYTPWKRMILPTDRMLSTMWHITCIYWMLV